MRFVGSGSGDGKPPRTVIALAVALMAAATTLGGCSGDTKPKAAPTAGAASPTVSAPNPLTGLGVPPAGPVIAVKVDDTAPGQPSLGVDKADVIYVEEVEGGLSRMLAVFATEKPRVRAVRSLRSSDMELLGQYGRIIVVASGGKRSTLRDLDRSGLRSSINDRAQVGFTRDLARPAPYNLVSDLARVGAAIKADGVRSVGFRWAARDPRLAGAKPALAVSTRVGTTALRFVWDATQGRYVRTVNGRQLRTGNGALVAKPNVMVQFCQIVPDPTDVDVNGSPTKFTKTVGSGRVVLFRNGKRIAGKWSRPSIGAPTTFTDAAGRPLSLAPGGTFVALVAEGAPA
jgi:hypothetical protein